MQRSEPQFCRDEAQRILELAKGCDEPRVRDHLAMMANEWLDRAKGKESRLLNASQTGPSCASGKKVRLSQQEQ
jgi:hypothetical protein